jgi:hypothetical protein
MIQGTFSVFRGNSIRWNQLELVVRLIAKTLGYVDQILIIRTNLSIKRGTLLVFFIPQVNSLEDEFQRTLFLLRVHFLSGWFTFWWQFFKGNPSPPVKIESGHPSRRSPEKSEAQNFFQCFLSISAIWIDFRSVFRVPIANSTRNVRQRSHSKPWPYRIKL